MNRTARAITALTGTVLVVLLVVFLVKWARSNTLHQPEPQYLAKKVGEDHWTIRKSARDEYLKHLDLVNKHIRIRPIQGDDPDSVTDFFIDQLAPDSPAYAAGFRSNDRILRINEQPVTTLGRAVNLIHEIRKSTRLTVSVERNGKTLHYRFDFE